MLAIVIMFVYLAIISVYWKMRVEYYETTKTKKLPPANTPEGKKERLILVGLLISTVVVVAFAALGSNLGSRQAATTILIFFTIAIIGFAVRMANRQK